MDITPEDLEKILKKLQEMPEDEKIKLAKAWEKFDKLRKQIIQDSMTVNVPDLPQSAGTDCSPDRSERIARQAGIPDHGNWSVLRTWTQDTILAKAKEYIPSLEHLRYAFAELVRTWNYTCQKQLCTNGRWVDSGHPYACNQTETKVVQVYGGPGESAPLQNWDAAAIRQSIASDYYK